MSMPKNISQVWKHRLLDGSWSMKKNKLQVYFLGFRRYLSLFGSLSFVPQRLESHIHQLTLYSRKLTTLLWGKQTPTCFSLEQRLSLLCCPLYWTTGCLYHPSQRSSLPSGQYQCYIFGPEFPLKRKKECKKETQQCNLCSAKKQEMMCSDSLSCKHVANHQHICQQGKSRSLLRPGHMQQFSFQWHDPFNWINKFRPSLSAVLLKAIDMKSENKLPPEKYVTMFFFPHLLVAGGKKIFYLTRQWGGQKERVVFSPAALFLQEKLNLPGKLTGKYIIGWFSNLFPTSSFILRRRL